jgi:hypothetical protein
MASTRKKTVVKAITERAIDEKKLESFDARLPNIDRPGYEAVCGSTGSGNIFKQFSEQIGCFSKDEHPSDWIDNRERFRKQFDKARQCFYGRVKRMNSFTANTNVTRKSRKGHAFAAKAAYGLGRNCLRKFADIPGSVAQDKFKNTADALIDSLTQNSVKKELRANGSTINDGLRADDSLKELYERTYDLEPENWAKFRHYAVLTAPDFEAKNYNGGAEMLRNAKQVYRDTFFETKPNSPESSGAAGGAGNATTYNTRRSTKKKGKKTYKNRKTTASSAAENAAAFNEALAEALAKNTANISRFPELETVTYDVLQKAAEGKTFEYVKVNTWYELPSIQIMFGLLDKVGTNEKLENRLMLELIAPFIYYRTSFEIIDLIHYILTNERLDKQSVFFSLVDYKFNKLKGRLLNDYFRLNYYLYTNLFNKSKLNPFSLTAHDIWPYLGVVENNLVKDMKITKKMRDRAIKNPIFDEWSRLIVEYEDELTTTYPKGVKGVKSFTTNNTKKPTAAASN